MRGDGGRRWRNEGRDCERETVGGYKGRKKERSDNEEILKEGQVMR